MKGYRVSSKVRFTIFMVIMILLTMTIIGNITGLNNVNSISKDCYRIVEIKSGDTLWNIAEKYSDNKDVRRVVYDICETNDIKADGIFTGQKILVPVNV